MRLDFVQHLLSAMVSPAREIAFSEVSTDAACMRVEEAAFYKLSNFDTFADKEPSFFYTCCKIYGENPLLLRRAVIDSLRNPADRQRAGLKEIEQHVWSSQNGDRRIDPFLTEIRRTFYALKDQGSSNIPPPLTLPEWFSVGTNIEETDKACEVVANRLIKAAEIGGMQLVPVPREQQIGGMQTSHQYQLNVDAADEKRFSAQIVESMGSSIGLYGTTAEQFEELLRGGACMTQNPAYEDGHSRLGPGFFLARDLSEAVFLGKQANWYAAGQPETEPKAPVVLGLFEIAWSGGAAAGKIDAKWAAVNDMSRVLPRGFCLLPGTIWTYALDNNSAEILPLSKTPWNQAPYRHLRIDTRAEQQEIKRRLYYDGILFSAVLACVGYSVSHQTASRSSIPGVVNAANAISVAVAVLLFAWPCAAFIRQSYAFYDREIKRIARDEVTRAMHDESDISFKSATKIAA